MTATAPAKPKELSFGVDGPGLTDLARCLWRDGEWTKAMFILHEGVGLDDDQTFALLAGKTKLDNADRCTLTLEDDSWTPPDGYLPPTRASLAEQLKEWQKWRKHTEKLQLVAPLVFACLGQKTPGGRIIGPGSPAGYVTADMLVWVLGQMLRPPTDEEHKAFWSKWSGPLREQLAEKAEEAYEEVNARLDRALPQQFRRRRAKDADAPTDTPDLSDYWALNTRDVMVRISFEAKMDRWKCPTPDPKCDSKGGYILPDGRFYPTIWMGHNWLASVLFRELGETAPATAGTMEQAAEAKGWVKVSHGLTGEKWVFREAKGTGEVPRRQADTIRVWCEKHGAKFPEWAE